MNSEKRLKLNPSPEITKGFLLLWSGQGFVFGKTKAGLALLYPDHTDKARSAILSNVPKPLLWAGREATCWPGLSPKEKTAPPLMEDLSQALPLPGIVPVRTRSLSVHIQACRRPPGLHLSLDTECPLWRFVILCQIR